MILREYSIGFVFSMEIEGEIFFEIDLFVVLILYFQYILRTKTFLEIVFQSLAYSFRFSFHLATTTYAT